MWNLESSAGPAEFNSYTLGRHRARALCPSFIASSWRTVSKKQSSKCTLCQSQGKQSETQLSVQLGIGRSEDQWKRPTESETGETREVTLKEMIVRETGNSWFLLSLWWALGLGSLERDCDRCSMIMMSTEEVAWREWIWFKIGERALIFTSESPYQTNCVCSA